MVSENTSQPCTVTMAAWYSNPIPKRSSSYNVCVQCSRFALHGRQASCQVALELQHGWNNVSSGHYSGHCTNLQLPSHTEPCLLGWLQHNTTQHNTTQHSTAQHSTAQHSTHHTSCYCTWYERHFMTIDMTLALGCVYLIGPLSPSHDRKAWGKPSKHALY